MPINGIIQQNVTKLKFLAIDMIDTLEKCYKYFQFKFRWKSMIIFQKPKFKAAELVKMAVIHENLGLVSLDFE